MLDDERVEHAFGEAPFFPVEQADCLELELECLVGSAFGGVEDQFVETDTERQRDPLNAALVALDLSEVQAERVGEGLLGPSALLAHGDESGRKGHA